MRDKLMLTLCLTLVCLIFRRVRPAGEGPQRYIPRIASHVQQTEGPHCCRPTTQQDSNCDEGKGLHEEIDEKEPKVSWQTQGDWHRLHTSWPGMCSWEVYNLVVFVLSKK